jgi:hypothetical protein
MSSDSGVKLNLSSGIACAPAIISLSILLNCLSIAVEYEDNCCALQIVVDDREKIVEMIKTFSRNFMSAIF